MALEIIILGERYEYGLETKARENLSKSWRLKLDRELVTKIYDYARGLDEELPEINGASINLLVSYFDTAEGKEHLRANSYQQIVDGKFSDVPLWMRWCIVALIDTKLLHKSFWKMIRSDEEFANYELQTVLKRVFLAVGASEADATTAVEGFLFWAVLDPLAPNF
ncbi:hypothetical protein N431DRAFT_500184 [Stipitochalara longipes BDJ]|nr:hypothetical protein N431DRAFT_500184 [Stipitochalara longipes BDJ]